MKVNQYETPLAFMKNSRQHLEQDEALNGVILGIVQRMIDEPERVKQSPFLANVCNESGHIVLTAMMTPPHPLALTGELDKPSLAINTLVEHLLSGAWEVPNVYGPEPLPEIFTKLWAKNAQKTYSLEMGQGLYKLSKVSLPVSVGGQLVQAHLEHLPLITGWMEAFEIDAFGEPQTTRTERTDNMKHRLQKGEWYLWEVDGTIRSMAMHSRPTKKGISVSGVYTPPEYRRRGYASACVAALSQRLLDVGYEFITLYTDLANPTSNKIYQAIGYQHLCDQNKYKFE